MALIASQLVKALEIFGDEEWNWMELKCLRCRMVEIGWNWSKVDAGMWHARKPRRSNRHCPAEKVMYRRWMWWDLVGETQAQLFALRKIQSMKYHLDLLWAQTAVHTYNCFDLPSIELRWDVVQHLRKMSAMQRGLADILTLTQKQVLWKEST